MHLQLVTWATRMFANVVYVIVCIASLLWMVFMGRDCLGEISKDHAGLQSV